MVARFTLSLLLVFSITHSLVAAPAPSETIASAQTVLAESLTTQIPAALLRDAYGVAIIPSVLKIGFIGGVRRGHGVVLVKDKDGSWGAPRFVTITGGSVGWQIGAQSTDVVLVFNSQRSVEGMLKGKFTIGADAAAAAGPVGRNLAAATDAQLKAEILSYSRSRGLFAGVSIDGSALDIDEEATTQYYAVRPGEPAGVPAAAVKLVETMAGLTAAADKVELAPDQVQPVPQVADAELIRTQLATSAVALNGMLKAEWQRYLALPSEVYSGRGQPSDAALGVTLQNYERVAATPEYASLSQRAEFQRTLELLRAYSAALPKAGAGQLNLPPPPGK